MSDHARLDAPHTLVSTHSVQRQMEVLRDLALLFNEMSDDKAQGFGERVKYSAIASALNSLSLVREIITAPCTVQQVLSYGHPIYSRD